MTTRVRQKVTKGGMKDARKSKGGKKQSYSQQRMITRVAHHKMGKELPAHETPLNDGLWSKDLFPPKGAHHTHIASHRIASAGAAVAYKTNKVYTQKRARTADVITMGLQQEPQHRKNDARGRDAETC